jgi:hypothetical protein
MTDLLDTTLAAAGRVPEGEGDVRNALTALVSDRERATRPRRRRILVPALSLGLALGVLGAGAVAASQWGPWTYITEPDLIVSRDWVDLTGESLGSCETRLATEAFPEDAAAEARAFLAELDVDAIRPDPEYVASMLVAVDRPGDLDRLVAGVDIDDFDITHTGSTWDQALWSDARILQSALTQEVFVAMSDALRERWPELADNTTAHAETQCTTDPIDADAR